MEEEALLGIYRALSSRPELKIPEGVTDVSSTSPDNGDFHDSAAVTGGSRLSDVFGVGDSAGDDAIVMEPLPFEDFLMDFEPPPDTSNHHDEAAAGNRFIQADSSGSESQARVGPSPPGVQQHV